MNIRSCLLVFVFAVSSLAQNGALQGVVTDQSQGVIARARVTVTNLETGLHRTAETNEVGFYSVPFLPAGRYKLGASMTGFGESERPEIKLDVQQTARVDFVLKPGAVVERIEVSAARALLDSETSTVGQVIDNKRIIEMPLNGRNYMELAALTAGVVPATRGGKVAEGAFMAAGQNWFQLQVNLDGVDNTPTSSGGPSGSETQLARPSLDAVDQFRVVTSNLSAEYGHRMGGQLFVTIKSGTNQLHGSAFEFLRNSVLDGTNFFANRSGAPKPPYRQNQFGGTLGGPIRKDRTFFFGSFEGTRTRLGQSFVSTVPVLEVRQGDFSRIRPVFDPATTLGTGGSMTRQVFPGNVIPRSRWDPLFPKLLDLYPLPSDNSKITDNYFYSPSQKSGANVYDFKGDHSFSDTSRVSLRYSLRDKDLLDPGPLPRPADGGSWQATALLAHTMAVSHVKTFGATLSNEVRFGFSHLWAKYDIPYDRPLFDEYGIKGIPKTYVASSNDHGLTALEPTGYAALGSRKMPPNTNKQTSLQFIDVAYKSHGAHALKFGGEYRWQNQYRMAARQARGVFTFGREFTANPQARGSTGDGMAEFMLGTASGGSIGNEQGESLNHQTFALFFQDDWKLTQRLTLNLGLRYDVFYTPWSTLPTVSNFVLDYSRTGPDARLQQLRPCGPRDCMCENDWNNLAPRVGLAYRVKNRTVLRAGFGVIYGRMDSVNSQEAARVQNQAPDWVELSFSTLDRITPALVLKNGFPAVELPAKEVPGPGLVQIRAADRFQPDQYSQQWFLDVQRELPFGILTTLGYAGNGTRHLSSYNNVNLPFGPSPVAVANRRIWPFYSSVTWQIRPGNVSYNAFTWKVDKRFRSGWQLLSGFSWAHTISLFDPEGNPAPVNPYNWQLNRSSSSDDFRRVFTVSSVYELPFGKGKRWLGAGGGLDALLGGWQVGGILSLRTGRPFTVTTSGNITNAGGGERPNRISDGQLPKSEQSIDRWFDVSAFRIQPQYTYGNSGRNILTGPGLRNLDFSLSKSFRVGENKRLQFRCESFNLSNTPAFGQPAANVAAAGAGTINSAGEPRRIQFGLKFVM
jgi:hypothetical protein